MAIPESKCSSDFPVPVGVLRAPAPYTSGSARSGGNHCGTGPRGASRITTKRERDHAGCGACIRTEQPYAPTPAQVRERDLPVRLGTRPVRRWPSTTSPRVGSRSPKSRSCSATRTQAPSIAPSTHGPDRHHRAHDQLSAEDTSPVSSPMARALITRRMILPLRVLGKVSANSRCDAAGVLKRNPFHATRRRCGVALRS